ncbi:hypothetical protein [Mesobacillus zeae]|uniref:Uncharacterized protein n=1 Tax=Mesobacillus zeae TaxID=1917180 RepID=A0A398BGW7_9BACI|nr:hypothetical protein [Mesobacillus zeae]RID88967.1 hypothetical protein D1970_00250 [Mesobacillus zeae]
MGLLLFGILAAIVATTLLGMTAGADDFVEWLLSVVLGLCIGAGSLAIGIIPAFVASTTPANPIEVEIYAIKDNSEVQGQFSLGYGSVDEEQYYYYVTESNDGFKKIAKAEVDNSALKEESIDNPYVVVYENKFDSAFMRFMYGDYNGSNTYEFHVPNNTITTDYNVDLE